MSVYFLDTSAIAKRYLPEPGSAWVRALFNAVPRPPICAAQFMRVELISALVRRTAAGSLTKQQFQQSEILFLSHLKARDYEIVELSAAVLASAAQLVKQHSLRTLDAMQLASALKLKVRVTSQTGPLIFLSADDRLLAAASAEGLSIDNPNLHP